MSSRSNMAFVEGAHSMSLKLDQGNRSVPSYKAATGLAFDRHWDQPVGNPSDRPGLEIAWRWAQDAQPEHLSGGPTFENETILVGTMSISVGSPAAALVFSVSSPQP